MAVAGGPPGPGGRSGVAGPGSPHRSGPGRAGAVGWLAARHRGGVQLLVGCHPHLLHGRTGSGHCRPRRDGCRHGVAEPTPPDGSGHRCGGHPRHRGLGLLASPAHAGLRPVVASGRSDGRSHRRRRPRGRTRRSPTDPAAHNGGTRSGPGGRPQWADRILCDHHRHRSHGEHPLGRSHRQWRAGRWLPNRWSRRWLR